MEKIDVAKKEQIEKRLNSEEPLFRRFLVVREFLQDYEVRIGILKQLRYIISFKQNPK